MADIVKIKKSKVINLSKLKEYSFDERYCCKDGGPVYLIKEEEGDVLHCKEMKPFITRDGYVEYVLTQSTGDKKHIQEQRIVAGLFLIKLVGKDYVNHKNGKRDDNRSVNLQWSTVSENIKHSFDKLGKVVWNKGKKG